MSKKKTRKDKGKNKVAAPKTAGSSDEEEEAEDSPASEDEEEEEFPTFAGFAEEDLNDEDEDVEAEVESEPEFDGTSLYLRRRDLMIR